MTGPLAGIRIVDLTTMISGPFATMLLGDQGADVIKIERVDGGDQMRRFGRRSGTLTAPFVNNNRSKRSVAVDLKRPEGIEVVKRLLSGADVFVQNFRPGVVARLGLGEEVARGLNPRLVYVSISGFGDKGPLAHKPAYDPIFQAASGLALPVPHNCSLDFMKPLRYRGHHGDSKSGRTPPAGQSFPTSQRARRSRVARYQKPRAGGRSRL